jgi:two-component system, chemotaxis family, protein-glutamate methylesterase/glutaminase
MTVKVLIVDDSAVVRQVLGSVLEADREITVIGAVTDPLFAMQRMNQQWPDVVVLDVEMPRMDGITFLKEIMAVRPTPVVICSTLTERGTEISLQALSAGAVAIVTKPRSGLKQFLESDAGDLVRTVKGAASGNMRRLKAMTSAIDQQAGQPAATRQPGALPVTTDRVVAIGTSTGGTQALEVVLAGMPRVAPGIVVVQHMPEKFTAAFADRLDTLCDSQVVEASDGDRVLPGHVLIAPGGRHMSLRRDGAQYRVKVADGPPVNRHKPSVDVLFRSVAECAGRNAMGIIMTGMGDDGARGLKQMHDAGARTFAQDEATCVVFGMPGEAVKLGAVDREVPLPAIAGLIEQYAVQG